MSHKIITLLAWLLILTLCLTGCGSTEAAAAETTKTAETAEIAETAPAVQAKVENRHITMQFSENHIMDADVYAPDDPSCTSFTLKPLTVTPEEAADILIPGDDSERSLKDSTLTTQAGNKVSVHPEIGFFDFSTDRDFDWEIKNVLEEYARCHPEAQGKALDFMTPGQAQAQGEKLMKDLGVCFEPVLQTCVGLTHQELEDYQQELFNRPEGYGIKTPILKGLTEDDDAYLLTFAFNWNGLPIYGYENEPTMGWGPGGFPVSLSGASMVISRQGLTSLAMWEVYSAAEPKDTQEVVGVETLLDDYAERWEEFTRNNPQEKLRINSIFLEYMPIRKGKTTTLVPYWCFPAEMEWQNSFTGEKIWDFIDARRFNAFTGADLTFGG